MPDYLGKQFGNYQLTRLLGQGGFAEVYLGEHIHLGTQAAIKVLHTQLTHDDIEKFRTEARTIARLIHPHIVRVLEFGVEGKIPFLVMDYASKGTLRQHHPRGVALPLTTVVSYVKQIADSLDYAHGRKVIHRDIKPENMLLGENYQVLLSDFGIALVLQSSRYQSIQEMVGTMAYMAPEQIQGKPRPASDQYALGIVVYEWLSGDRPFHGSLTELVGQHLSVPPSSLCEKIPTLSSTVEEVVFTALSKDPQHRFDSIQAFADALEQANKSERPSLSHSAVVLSQPPDPTLASPLSKEPAMSESLSAQKSRSTLMSKQPISDSASTVPPLVPRNASDLPSLPTISKWTIMRRLVGVALVLIVGMSYFFITGGTKYSSFSDYRLFDYLLIILIPLIIIARISYVTTRYALFTRICLLVLLIIGITLTPIFDLWIVVLYSWLLILLAFILIERTKQLTKRYAIIVRIGTLVPLIIGLVFARIFGVLLVVIFAWFVLFLATILLLDCIKSDSVA